MTASAALSPAPGASPREELHLWLLSSGVVVAALAWLYAPTVTWLLERWGQDEYYGHGPLLPLITVYLAWRKRAEISAAWAARHEAAGGPWLLLFGLAVQLAGMLSDVRLVQSASIPFTLLGIARFAGGARLERELRFPLLFLLMAVPLSHVVVQSITVPLQVNAASYAAMFLGVMGLPIERVGVNLYTPQYNFVVAVPCSGLKTALTLLTLSLVVAHLMPNLSGWGRCWLCVLSVPIAFIANVVRIIVIVMIGHFFGTEAAEGFFHNFSGAFMFLVAFALLVGCSNLIGGKGSGGDSGGNRQEPKPKPQAGAPPEGAISEAAAPEGATSA